MQFVIYGIIVIALVILVRNIRIVVFFRFEEIVF